MMIMEGHLPMDAYRGQQLAVEALQTAMLEADRQCHGGRMWKSLPRKDFIAVVLKVRGPAGTSNPLLANRYQLCARWAREVRQGGDPNPTGPVHQVFPMKSPEDLRGVKRALSYDQPPPPFVY